MKRSLIAAFLFTASAAAQKLAIVEPQFHQFDGGPPLRQALYRDGERVFVTCQVAGYKAEKEKESVRLELSVEARDEAGLLLAPADNQKVDVELAPEDKDWKPKLRYQFEVPQTASCKACELRIKVRDLVAGADATRSVPFAVESKTVEPSATLAVRNVRFLRAEDDSSPLAVPAYRPGDEIWARFEMTGYKLGDKNRIQLEYGLSVYRPSGKLLYQQLNAASADDTSFYPKKWMPGILSLKADTKMPPGEYPIVLEVRDLIGQQKHEERFTFRIE